MNNIFQQLESSGLSFDQIVYLNQYLKKNVRAHNLLKSEQENTLEYYKFMKTRAVDELSLRAIDSNIDYLETMINSADITINKLGSISEQLSNFVESIQSPEDYIPDEETKNINDEEI